MKPTCGFIHIHSVRQVRLPLADTAKNYIFLLFGPDPDRCTDFAPFALLTQILKNY